MHCFTRSTTIRNKVLTYSKQYREAEHCHIMLSLYSLSLTIIFVAINVNAMNTYFESDNRYEVCTNSKLIKTIEECDCAAKKLKMTYEAAIEVDKPKSNWPGCYITNDGLYFNSDVDNRRCYGDSGRYKRKCLCIRC